MLSWNTVYISKHSAGSDGSIISRLKVYCKIYNLSEIITTVAKHWILKFEIQIACSVQFAAIRR